MSRLNSLVVSSKLVHVELVSLHCSAICIVVSHPRFRFSFLKENRRRGKLNLRVCACVPIPVLALCHNQCRRHPQAMPLIFLQSTTNAGLDFTVSS